jgi:3',5'-cyclic AMP phosphodiesterase CpdA
LSGACPDIGRGLYVDGKISIAPAILRSVNFAAMNLKNRFCFYGLFAVCCIPLLNLALPAKQNNSGNLRFVVYGDTRTNDKAHRRVVALALEQQPLFIMQTGDLVEDSSSPHLWAVFNRAIQPIRQQHIGYYPAKGNHDLGQGSQFAAEILDPVQSGNKDYYRFDVQRLRFIALDTESLSRSATAINTAALSHDADGKEDSSAGATQYRWLKNELEQAKADKVFVIPFFHRALYSVGRHGSDIALRNLLHPLFRQYGVRLVFQGHDHLYYHAIRDDIHYVVTGGGGAPLYNIHKKSMQPGDIARKVHHICVAELLSDRIHIMVYAAEKGSAKNEAIDDFNVPLAADQPN